jgi:ABC-type glycerol-3-phosphate transport system permease component
MAGLRLGRRVLTPLFLELHFLHLLNSLIGLALFYTTFNLPVGVYVMTNDSLFTLPVALSNVETGTYGSVNYGLLLAGAVIAVIPCVLVYVLLQRYYVRGLVSGALKG